MDQSKIFTLSDTGIPQLYEARQLYNQLIESTDVNASYQYCYQVLKMGGLAAEIPRLVVFGQQSMGKTTLLDFIMGGPIGFSSTDTGTKQPVVIMLKPNETGNGKIECKLQGKSIDIQNLHTEMKSIMNKIKTVSEQEIELQMFMPNCAHAIFVDLPGIKDDSKEGAQLTRNVVRNYVQNNPNDIYILVKKASDDPANWPWSLKDFILKGPPNGLGLSCRQTIVVGTRAKEFLINEKTDISTQADLLDRVIKRSIRDSTGKALPLYLLELFSFSLQQKEISTFQQRRESMFDQISQNSLECRELIVTQFEKKKAVLENTLLKYFDVNAFKEELNLKLQTLLSEQLTILLKRLKIRSDMIKEELQELEVELYEQNPQSIREGIYLFIRELSGIITELVTGNYMIIRFPDNGEDFLKQFGGNLKDNLEEGHKMAMELFPNREHYPENFLNTINSQAELVLKKSDEYNESNKLSKQKISSIDQSINFEAPQPELTGVLQPGQTVRFAITKDKSRVLGFIQSINSKGKDSSETANVAFYYVSLEDDTSEEHTQTRAVKFSRLDIIYPLTAILAYDSTALPPLNFRCWMRKLRTDSWIGLIPVSIRRVVMTSDTTSDDPIKATVHYVPILPNTSSQNLLSGDQADEYNAGICDIDEIYIDADSFDINSPHKYKVNSWKTLSQLQRIAGDFAETPLLNQLSLTYLGRWLKFHILSLEPNKKFSHHVMLQLMRSVKNVIDKADWEPLVADLLQANVRGNLLQLTKLASCATASALKRILRAAIYEN